MNLRKNKVILARRLIRRRALWYLPVFALCILIVLLRFVKTGAFRAAQNSNSDYPVTTHPHRPNLPPPNDISTVTPTPQRSAHTGPQQMLEHELEEMITAEVAEEAHNILPVKISKHRADLLETLSTENTLDSIENLPNFDDTRIKHTIADALPYDSYAFLIQFLPKLTRIRKIIQETQSNATREQVIAVLTQKLEYSINGYSDVLVEFHNAMLAAGGSIRHLRPPEHRKRQTYSAAAVYLFSELRAYETLPLLSKLYHCKRKLPVSRLFVFYSMHLLASDYPREALSAKAEKALDAYLLAVQNLPQPVVLSVTTPDAAYHEADPRIWIRHQDILKGQPKCNLRMYPPSLIKFEKESWGTPPTNPYWLAVDPEIHKLARKLKAFIDLIGSQNQPVETHPENQ